MALSEELSPQPGVQRLWEDIPLDLSLVRQIRLLQFQLAQQLQYPEVISVRRRRQNQQAPQCFKKAQSSEAVACATNCPNELCENHWSFYPVIVQHFRRAIKLISYDLLGCSLKSNSADLECFQAIETSAKAKNFSKYTTVTRIAPPASLLLIHADTTASCYPNAESQDQVGGLFQEPTHALAPVDKAFSSMSDQSEHAVPDFSLRSEDLSTYGVKNSTSDLGRMPEQDTIPVACYMISNANSAVSSKLVSSALGEYMDSNGHLAEEMQQFSGGFNAESLDFAHASASKIPRDFQEDLSFNFPGQTEKFSLGNMANCLEPVPLDHRMDQLRPEFSVISTKNQNIGIDAVDQKASHGSMSKISTHCSTGVCPDVYANTSDSYQNTQSTTFETQGAFLDETTLTRKRLRRQDDDRARRVCENCASNQTRQWVKGENDSWLCHSCGQFWRKNGHNRPRHLWNRPQLKRKRRRENCL